MNPTRPRAGRRVFRPGLKLVGCVLCAGLFIFIGAVNLRDLHGLGRRSEIVTATVIDETWRPPSVTVRFTTRSGQPVVADGWRFDHEPEIGDQVRIEYDPRHPSRIQEAGWGHSLWPVFVFFGFAVLVLLLGVRESLEHPRPE